MHLTEAELKRGEGQAHLAQCEECRALREWLEPESDEARAALDGATRSPAALLAAAQLRAGPGALKLRAGIPWRAVAAVAAAVLLVVLLRPREVALLDERARPLEVAFAEQPWAPYQPQRGAPDEARFDRALRRLLEAQEKGAPGASRKLAMLFLLRGGQGDAARADQALERAGAGPDVDNDRGVARFARGDFAAALEQFDRALAADPAHSSARFNRALALDRLGLGALAAAAFDALGDSAWGREGRERAARIRSRAPAQPAGRGPIVRALLSAGTLAEVAAVQKQLGHLPAGFGQDLSTLAARLARFTPLQLDEHKRLFGVWAELRGRIVAGKAQPAEAEELSRLRAVVSDPVLWAPALQLAGYAHAARGEWRAAQRFDASLAQACPARGCPVETQAIALDELADLAARDADFASAHALQAKAEALFASVDAELQLAELHRKRAALLLEERRRDEAAESAQLAVRELSGQGGEARGALGLALLQAAEIAGTRGQPHAAAELGAGALQLARELGDAGLESSAAAVLAESEPRGARELLEREVRALEQAGQAASAAALRAPLAEVLLKEGNAEGALAASSAGAAAWGSDQVRLALAHARALVELKRTDEARAELAAALRQTAQATRGAADPAAAIPAAAFEAARVLASMQSGEAALLPLELLRSAMVGAAAAEPGWSAGLPDGACVLGAGQLVRRGGSAPLAAPLGAGAAATASADPALDGCAELWLFGADAPASWRGPLGTVTSLARLLAPEPPAPRGALFVSAQAAGDAAGAAVALPGAAQELAALRAQGQVIELSGARSTPELVQELSAAQPLLHFAVHGFDGAAGGFLQLAGPQGRFGAHEISGLRLQPHARVVLSACEAAAPGPRGVAWAFARAGALEIAAAQGKVDDAAAARWSAKFYAALGRGLNFVRAAHEASPEANFTVLK